MSDLDFESTHTVAVGIVGPTSNATRRRADDVQKLHDALWSAFKERDFNRAVVIFADQRRTVLPLLKEATEVEGSKLSGNGIKVIGLAPQGDTTTYSRIDEVIYFEENKGAEVFAHHAPTVVHFGASDRAEAVRREIVEREIRMEYGPITML